MISLSTRFSIAFKNSSSVIFSSNHQVAEILNQGGILQFAGAMTSLEGVKIIPFSNKKSIPSRNSVSEILSVTHQSALSFTH